MEQNPNTCDILIVNPLYLDAAISVQSAECIAIREGKIVHLGKNIGWQATQVFPGDGYLWMPGLVDGHIHTSQQLLRGRLLDERPVIWKRINLPFEAKLDEESSELSAGLAALEMIRCGTTGFVDAGGKYTSSFAKVYQKSGLRGSLSCMTTDNPAIPDSLRVNVKKGLEKQKELQQMLNGGLLKGVFSVTALTAASKELIVSIFSYAKEHGIATEVHMNEYANEVYAFIEQFGKRPFEWLHDEELIGNKFIAAHCIYLSQKEMEIIRENRVRVIHCPFSNCGKGVPATPQLLASGAIVGFGSDGSAHGGLDLFREMRLFRSVMNVCHGVQTADPQVMPTKQILTMATQGGAHCLDTQGLGKLESGAPADMIALMIDAPHLQPTHNLLNTVLESASGSDVAHMIVDGKILMKNREVLTLDTEKIMYQAHAWQKRHNGFTETLA